MEDLFRESFGPIGWREFLSNRDEILTEYDRVKAQIANRPVQTAHGVAGDAAFRRWLLSFLPKKFSVTAGYIIHGSWEGPQKLRHYDVIVYDAIESPVLWIEGNHDDSEQGRYRAIPARYVKAVFEIKARLTKEEARKAVSKLKEIDELKEFLPTNFMSGLVFFELKKEDINDYAILEKLVATHALFNFFSGVVLRCDVDSTITGNIEISCGDALENRKLPLAMSMNDLDLWIREDGNLQVASDGARILLMSTSNKNWVVSKGYAANFCEESQRVCLAWSRNGFAEFAMNVLTRLQSTTSDWSKALKFGMVFDKINRKEGTPQPSIRNDGSPFLVLALENLSEEKSFAKITESDEDIGFKIKVAISNHGNVAAVISDDGFDNSATLDPGQTKRKEFIFTVRPRPDSQEPIDRNWLEKKLAKTGPGFQFPFRVAYYPVVEDGNKKDFFVVKQFFELHFDRFIILDEPTNSAGTK